MSNKFLETEFETMFSSNLKETLLKCADSADKYNYKIYLIGGAVRDMLLGRECLDIDVLIEGDAVKFAEILEKADTIKIISIQENLRTAKVLFPSGHEFDFASTRKEIYPKNGELPVITDIGCDLKQDVVRRDFTVNTMAMILNSSLRYMLVDYLGGYNDLKKKQLRILHNNSFIDDPSRIIRGLKFCAKLNFSLGKETLNLQEHFLNELKNRNFPYERIKSEIKEALNLNSLKVYELFIHHKIYKLISDECDEKTDITKIQKLISSLSVYINNIWLVFLILLFKNNLSSLKILNLTAKDEKIISDFSELNSNPLTQKDNYSVYKFFENKETDSITAYHILHEDDYSIKFLKTLKQVKLLSNGHDLIKLGLKPSKQYSEIFEKVLEKKLNSGLSSIEEELAFIQTLIKF